MDIPENRKAVELINESATFPSDIDDNFQEESQKIFFEEVNEIQDELKKWKKIAMELLEQKGKFERHERVYWRMKNAVQNKNRRHINQLNNIRRQRDDRVIEALSAKEKIQQIKKEFFDWQSKMKLRSDNLKKLFNMYLHFSQQQKKALMIYADFIKKGK